MSETKQPFFLEGAEGANEVGAAPQTARRSSSLIPGDEMKVNHFPLCMNVLMLTYLKTNHLELHPKDVYKKGTPFVIFLFEEDHQPGETYAIGTLLQKWKRRELKDERKKRQMAQSVNSGKKIRLL